MKSLFLYCCILLCSLYSYSQSLTGPATAVSESDITLVASGESNSSYITFSMYIMRETSIISPSSANYNSFDVIGGSAVSTYNPASKQPTKISLKVKSMLNEPITLKLAFEVSLTSFPGGGAPVIRTLYHTITINPKPAPTVYYNQYEVVRSALKNDCGAGYMGENYIEYRVPAGKHSSIVSQADANNKAIQDAESNVQAQANRSGACIVAVVNTPASYAAGYPDPQIKEDVKWTPSYFTGNVRIELHFAGQVTANTPITSQYDGPTTLERVINASVPNTGVLKDGLLFETMHFSGMMIKVIDINTGKVYNSRVFNWIVD